MNDYRCTNGHDRCSTSYPGPDCPYCERPFAGVAKAVVRAEKAPGRHIHRVKRLDPRTIRAAFS